MEWWERLHLKDNPFERTRNPLTGSMDYIVETPIFKKYDLRTRNIDTLFGKVFVVYGPFGSGKTTLFEYLRNKLGIIDKKLLQFF